MRLDDIFAIDMHVHLRDEVTLKARGHRSKAMDQHFKQKLKVVPVDELAAVYRERRMLAVLVNSADEYTTGRPAVANDHIARIVADHPDVFLGFGIVEPQHGRAAVDELTRCVQELGLVGIGELNPARQHFYPNDPAWRQLWSRAEELGVPVMFHSGYPGAGSGQPGGEDVRLKYVNPMFLDDVAADHPGLRVICSHPGWPWESEALAVTLHKGNVFLDLSGWAPRYVGEEVRQYVRRRITDKAMFGSDWPVLQPDRWLEEFKDWNLDPDAMEKVLKLNAIRVLSLESRFDDLST